LYMIRLILIFTCFIFSLKTTHAQTSALTLDEAIARALQQNFGVKVLQNDVQIATNNAVKGNAGFLPTINLNVAETPSLGLTYQSFAGGTRADVNATNITNNFNANVQLQWTLYDGRRMFLELDRLKELKGLSEITVKIRSELIIADVMRAYYNVIRQQELYKGIQEQMDLFEERLRIAQTRLEVGKGNQLDVLQAQSDLNVQKTQLTRQKQAIGLAKMTLNQAMTIDLNFDYNINDSFRLTNDFNLSNLINTSFQENLAVSLLKKQEGILMLTKQEIESLKKPRLTFNSALNFNRNDNTAGLFLVNQNSGLNAGLALTYPLYEGGNIKRQAENAKIGIVSLQIQQKQLEFELSSGLTIAYQNFKNAVEILRGEEENMQIARQSIVIAMERFRLSRSTILELKQIQQTYDNALVRAIAAKFEAKAAEIELMRISGGLIKGK
jgi:outer membrane protein